jgi:hypothetical protein
MLRYVIQCSSDSTLAPPDFREPDPHLKPAQTVMNGILL